MAFTGAEDGWKVVDAGATVMAKFRKQIPEA
jgi:hypothetical protein